MADKTETRTATIKGTAVQFEVPEGSDDDFVKSAAIQAYRLSRFNKQQKAFGNPVQYTGKPSKDNPAGSIPAPFVQPYNALTGFAGPNAEDPTKPPRPGIDTDTPAEAFMKRYVVSPLQSLFAPELKALNAPVSGESWQGKTGDAIEGATSAATKLFAPELLAHPIQAARVILPAAGFGYGGQEAATALGAKPDTARMTGDLTGLVGASLFGSPMIGGAVKGGFRGGKIRAESAPPNRLGGIIGGLGGLATAAKEGVGGFGDYAGYRIGKETGENLHPIEFAKGFVKGAVRGAKGKPILPFEPTKTDNFQAKAPSKPSPVVNTPKALPPSPVITTPPPVPSQIEGPGAGLRPAVNAPAQLSQGPIVTPSPLPEPVPPSRQLNQPMPWRGPGDLNTGQPQVTAPMLSNQPAAVPKTPIAPVQPPAPVAQRPLVSAPVQAPPVQAAPPPVQAPVQIQTPPAAPPEPITPMQAPAVPGEPVKPPLAPSANIPVRATSRELEVNDLYKTPESIIPFIKNKVDISAANLARDSSVSLDHAARLLKAANEKGLIVTAKKDQYAWKSEPKNPVHAPESKVKPKVSVEPSLEDLPGPTDAELGPKDNVVTDEDRAMGKAARKVNPPTRQREITVNKPGEKPSVSKETKTTQKAPDAEQPAEDKGSSGGQQEQKDQNAKTVVKNYDKAALGFSDSAHVDRALFAALGKTKLPRAEWKKFYASEFPGVESLDDMSTNQKLQLIEKVTGKELSPKDKGKPFPESSFGKDSKSGKYGFGF